MNAFCVLCIPFLYFLRRAGVPGERHNIWALPLGGAAAAASYFFGPAFAVPGAFGFSRWLSGFVDVVALPSLLPLIACLLFVSLKKKSVAIDYAGFALLWLAPLALVNSMDGSLPSPIPLVLTPLLWAAQAVGASFLIGCVARRPRPPAVFFLALAIAALPIAATTSWWFFFRQQPLFGWIALAPSLAPAVAAFCKPRGNASRIENPT